MQDNSSEFDKALALIKFHTRDKIDLLNALKDKFGKEVVQVVEQTECEKAFITWQNIALQCADHSIESLIQLLWEPLRAKGFEFSFEKKPEGVQMQCTKCPIYDLAKELDALDWMYHHTCLTDPYIAEGFNPQIGLKRSKTLMQGDSCCDHFYYYKEK